jgi:signal transduction histidine kinase/ligand-binding sensor domain-containing protein
MAKRAGMVAGALLAFAGAASALNPSLDVNQYAHKAWTIRDGFFRGTINAIAQTPDGYLWLGTEFGLLRFDGVWAVPWQPPAGEHLPANYVHTLLAARDGRLWIGTDAGLTSWRDGKLSHYPELAGQSIGALLEDREGTIWAGGWAPPVTGRLCAIRGDSSPGQEPRCFGKDAGLGYGVLSLHEDNRGNLWAGASNGLWRWKPGPPKRFPMAGAEIFALIDGDDGALLIAANGGMRQIVDGKLEAYSVPGAGQQFKASRLLRDRNGGLWIGTADRGLSHVHQGKTDVFAQSDGLSGGSVYKFFEDREGNVWVATDQGLDRFRDFDIPTLSVKQGLSTDDVWSVLTGEDGSVWLGTREGLNKWNNGRATVSRKGSGGLPDNANSLFQDDRGRIWVSMLSGVAWFENGRSTPVRGVPGGNVHAIAGDHAGDLWIANQDQGLFHLTGGRVVEQIPWARLGRKDFGYALSPDPVGGGLWLGFYLGGVAYFKDGQVRATYAANDGLGEGRVENFQLDRDGALWAATQGGLSRVKNSRVATLTSRNGLPCDAVHWVTEDDDHSFWLYMPCGLVRIARTELDAWVADSKRTIRTTVFDSSDGVVTHAGHVSGYSPRVARSIDGKLWFLSGAGVSVIDPHNLPFNKLPPPVHIEQIVADRKTYETSSNQRLPALTRDLEMDYTALSLLEPGKNRFRVKLEGWDRDWKDVGNERKAFYSNLPPRSYRFRVMASNNSGVWNEAGASFDFSIKPAYYQTRWFQASCVAAFLALLWALYRLRLHQIAQGFNARLEERVGERTRIARELHDTLLQSFQGLMLHLQVVDEMLPDGRAKEKLEQSLERADKAIAEGREAVHDLRSSAVTTNELAQSVRALGNELAGEDGAAFRLVVEGPARDLHPIVRDEIYRIAREALRNAFSHARARHIEVEITYSERLLRLRIRDDGQGMAPAILEEGRPGHYGLPGMRERASQIGAKLSIWSAVRAGTEIELSIAGSIAYGKSPHGGQRGRSRLRLFRRAAG